MLSCSETNPWEKVGGPGLMCKCFPRRRPRVLTFMGVDINNVGSIVQALFAANGDGWDETAAAAAQAYQVSIISVCSSLGRLIIGTCAVLYLSRVLTLTTFDSYHADFRYFQLSRLLGRLHQPQARLPPRKLFDPLLNFRNYGSIDVDLGGECGYVMESVAGVGSELRDGLCALLRSDPGTIWNWRVSLIRFRYGAGANGRLVT